MAIRTDAVRDLIGGRGPASDAASIRVVPAAGAGRHERPRAERGRRGAERRALRNDDVPRGPVR
jgi:hypothetical protein